MIELQIDTTIAKVAKVRLLKDGQLLTESETSQPLVSLTQALKKANLNLGEIDKFLSNPGPGSFTGVRVGAAVANTLNWVLSKNTQLIEPIYE